MKLFAAIVATLILAGIGSAETYQLGSHNVSINSDLPANYTEEIPRYSSVFDSWANTLNITPDMGGFIRVTITEYSIPIYGSALIDTIADGLINATRQNGLGGVKYAMVTYKEHDAFEISYPAQRVQKQQDGIITEWPESHVLIYRSDELDGITIQAINTGEDVFRRVLDSIEITKNSSTNNA